ncbi:MAG: FtsH protease activity modulator HflK [Alphaproteobacteria bacterium]|nr:FtsH protease activity modulator HflK [Alphaproteobacteria bacterium]
MSWNNGGPWGNSGSGSNGPSNPKRPTGNSPDPDLDEWLRKSRERLRKAFPGNAGGPPPKSLITLALVVIAVLWLCSGFYQVSTNQIGVVLRFGEVVRTEEAGLRYHLPEPIEMVLLPDVTTTHQIKIGFRDTGSDSDSNLSVEGESRMLTGDENIVDIGFSVFWRVRNAQDYLFNMRNPDLTVRLASESAIREIIGRMQIQPILTEKRNEIEQETTSLIQSMLDEYKAGVVVTQVQLLNVTPPQPVVDAFNDVQRARADGERLRNEAEAYRNDIIPRARGEAARMIQDAEGYREQVISYAKGDAARFESVLAAYKEARDVTATRLYFEAMENVLRNANKVLIDPAISKGGALPYLPLQDFIRNRTP